MNILLLSCSTGEGHNHCAQAVEQALLRRGHRTNFVDLLRLGGEPGALSFDRVLNGISSRTPEVFGMMYRAGQAYSSTGVTSPVYLANIRRARLLADHIWENRYDAVVCSHLFPMETLTHLRRHENCPARCYGILSDYACIPFLPETELDGYFLPHKEVLRECAEAGMPEEKLAVTGMPVAEAFTVPMEKQAAREALGLPQDRKIYLVMTGGVGCGDAVSLCRALRRVPDDGSLILVMPGRNDELREAVDREMAGQDVVTIPFTDQVAAYMHAADVLLSKAGGISSSEAAAAGVPLVHTMAIPGVETLNAQFFMRHGLSLFAENLDEAAHFADRLVYDGALRDKMLRTQAAWPRDGAERIAEHIERAAV